jgi:hypothetical protein
MHSCNTAPEQKEPFKSLLKNCDELNINFYNGGDTIHFQTKDSLGLKYLSQNIMGSTEAINDTCKPVGSLFYRSHGDTLLKAEFALLPTGNKNDCNYISYSYQNGSYKNRVSDKIYQLLTQMYPRPSPHSTMQASDSIQALPDPAGPPTDSGKK